MYNPPGDPERTVNFTDGKSWFLPKDTTITYRVCPEVLPVTLLDFEVQKQGDNALLVWKTASEMNNSHFMIQKSTDGQTFEDIAIVKGHGTTSTLSSYSFLDENMSGGVTYYRLKQVDYDGKYVFSVLRSIIFGSMITIFPNPATDKLHIKASGEELHDYTYSLISLAGQEVSNGSFSQEKIVDLSGLAASMYILLVKDENGQSIVTEKVIKE